VCLVQRREVPLAPDLAQAVGRYPVLILRGDLVFRRIATKGEAAKQGDSPAIISYCALLDGAPECVCDVAESCSEFDVMLLVSGSVVFFATSRSYSLASSRYSLTVRIAASRRCVSGSVIGNSLIVRLTAASALAACRVQISRAAFPAMRMTRQRGKSRYSYDAVSCEQSSRSHGNFQPLLWLRIR